MESRKLQFLNASNMAVLAAAGFGSLALGSLDKLTEKFKDVIPVWLTLAVLLILALGFAYVSLTYFADRQKSVVFAARKVIVLRRMLGLSYGTIQLVLPNWRIEGADEPFAVRLFPGWNTYVAYPYFALAGITSAFLLFLLAALAGALSIPKSVLGFPVWSAIAIVTAGWAILLAYIYRKALLDTHERPIWLLAVNLARLMRLKLVTNFEYIIYRATLARYEFVRLNIELANLKEVLVFIEDRGFFHHHGVSIRAIGRALLGLVGVKRRSGGSTISQQLARTLFVVDQTKLIRRKFTEILLAIWFDRLFEKNNQLELYLASVRFERGVYGVLEAMHYFWGQAVERPSKAEAFFLVERVSNVRSSLLSEKITQTLRAAINKGIMTPEDGLELYDLYRKAIDENKIMDKNGGIDGIRSVLNADEQHA